VPCVPAAPQRIHLIIKVIMIVIFYWIQIIISIVSLINSAYLFSTGGVLGGLFNLALFAINMFFGLKNLRNHSNEKLDSQSSADLDEAIKLRAIEQVD